MRHEGPVEVPYNLASYYYEPKFKMEFCPSDLPEYDGSNNAFIAWTKDLNCYAAGSKRMCEQLAYATSM
jgi:hypothetical protein